ncbi:unnamed protein product [Closterium sp. NIES-65]|nr:unnamed protein product [Closterium sp. NIES-65]
MEAWFVSMCFCFAVVFHQASAINGGAFVPTVLRVGRKEKLDLPGTVPRTHGRLVASPVSFSSGIKALAVYVHSKGLKLGLYSDSGGSTWVSTPIPGEGGGVIACFMMVDVWGAGGEGIGAADYGHSKGLKLGLYSDSG